MQKRWLLGISIFFSTMGMLAAADSTVSLVIDTHSSVMVIRGSAEGDIGLTDIAIGRYGVTRDKRRGDNMTPLGKYRVAWITDNSSFGTFIGIDYPNKRDAQRGFRKGVINERERRAILRAHRQGKVPSQKTALGGYLGIHGVGEGDPEVHRLYNWTRGCVAVTNEQLSQILSLISVGTPVEIR